MSELQRYSVYSSITDPWGFEIKPQSDGQFVDADDAVKYIAELKNLLNDFALIINESEGVAGYHLNGEVAKWDDLLELNRLRKVLGDENE